MTGWLPPLTAIVLALAMGGGAQADVCVVVDPLVEPAVARQGAPAGETEGELGAGGRTSTRT